MKRPQAVVFGILAVVTALALTACPNPVDPPPEPTTGHITGMALFNGGANHGGIVITLEETDGPLSASVANASRGIATGVRSNGRASVTRVTQTNSDGLFTFSDIPPGTYTLYASSQDSLERAVVISVTVIAGEESDVGTLNLTHVGSISGQITVNGYGTMGFIVSVAGTSFMAVTCDQGLFTIGGVPIGEHRLILVRGDLTIFFAEPVEVLGGADTEVDTKDIASETLDNTPRIVDGYWWVGNNNLKVSAQGQQGATPHIGPNRNWWIGETDLKVPAVGAAGVSIVWKGERAYKPADPQLNWAYFNTVNRTAYIWNGTRWDILAERGETGTDGTHGLSINWRGTFTGHPANPQPNWAYHNIITRRSYIFDGTGWQILASDGQHTGFVEVTGVTPEKDSTVMVIGQSERLEAQVIPGNATIRDMLWTSNSPHIASVDMFTGQVTAHAEGTATITVITVNGNRRATVTVTVKRYIPEPGDTARLLILQAGAAGSNGAIGRSFVELFNNTDAPIDLGTHSLHIANGRTNNNSWPQYAQAGWPWIRIDLNGIIQPRHSFLVVFNTVGNPANQRFTFTDDEADIVVPASTFPALSNRSFKVALMSNRNDLTVVNPFTGNDGTPIAGFVDLLGTVNDTPGDSIHAYEGQFAVAISQQASARRGSLIDTNNNSADFVRVHFGNVSATDFERVRPRSSSEGAWNPMTGESE